MARKAKAQESVADMVRLQYVDGTVIREVGAAEAAGAAQAIADAESVSVAVAELDGVEIGRVEPAAVAELVAEESAPTDAPAEYVAEAVVEPTAAEESGDADAESAPDAPADPESVPDAPADPESVPDAPADPESVPESTDPPEADAEPAAEESADSGQDDAAMLADVDECDMVVLRIRNPGSGKGDPGFFAGECAKRFRGLRFEIMNPQTFMSTGVIIREGGARKAKPSGGSTPRDNKGFTPSPVTTAYRELLTRRDADGKPLPAGVEDLEAARTAHSPSPNKEGLTHWTRALETVGLKLCYPTQVAAPGSTAMVPLPAQFRVYHAEAMTDAERSASKWWRGADHAKAVSGGVDWIARVQNVGNVVALPAAA